VHPRFGTPALVTAFTAVIAAAVGAFFPLDEIASLANAGTLAAFVAVALCMLILRFTHPGRERLFRAPVGKLMAPLAIAGCLYLFFNLSEKTILFFFAWNAIGIAVYLLWARRNSRLGLLLAPAIPQL
jgi:APA family basic amino acid/polyamine antiporter